MSFIFSSTKQSFPCVRQSIFLAAFLLGFATLSVGCAQSAETKSPNSSAPATYGQWRSVKMGGGGYLQNVVMSQTNPQRLYTYIDVGGVFRSDDGGNRWKMLHGNLSAVPGIYEVRGLLVDPRDDKRVLIAAGSQWGAPLGIFLTTDAGASWKKVLTARFMGNGPERWTGFILARHPQNPDIILTASEDTGVSRSTDNGNTWKPLGQTGLHPTDIRYDRSNPNRVWMCAQQFKGWLDGSEKTLNAGFFRSEDGGDTWRKISDTSPTEILQDPKNAGVIYGFLNDRPHISRDAGDTWQPLESGLPPREANHNYMSDARFQSFAAGPDFVLTASTRGTFYRLQSGETTWQKIERQGLEEIYEGEEWFRHKKGGYGWALASITINPRNPNHWFFTDWFAIYQTFDAGKNWKLSINGIEDTVLHALTQDPVDPGMVHLGMADNGYFWSENGGERFYLGEGISNNVKSISVARSQPSRVYAVGPQGHEWEANQVFVSINRGHNWTRSPMEGLPDMAKEGRKCNTIVADPKNPYVAYLAVSGNIAPGAGGVYKSTDGGKKWTWMSEGLPTVDKFFRDSIWDQGREIAVSPDGSLLCISREQGAAYRYDASTQKWTQSKPEGDGTYYAIVADNLTPGRYFLSLRWNGLFRSDDGGKTWKRVLDKSTGYVATDEIVKNRVAVGTEDGVMLSTDGGETWQELDRNLPYRINPIVAFAGERLVAGTAGNGAFWIPLSAKGAQPVKAKPATEVQVPGTVGSAPTIQNGDMAQGDKIPAGWTNVWQGSGKLEAVRDVSTHKGAPASLKLQSVGGAAYGTVSQNFAARMGGFTLSGWLKSSGNLDESLLAIQAFGDDGKQVGWITLVDVRGKKEWTQFRQTLSLPAGTKSWNLVLTLKGDGVVWLDEVQTQPEKSVFLD